MSKSGTRWLIGILIVVILLSGACSAGFVAGLIYPQEKISSFLVLPGMESDQILPGSSSEINDDLDKLFAPFWQAWKLVHDQYVDQPVDDVVLMRGALEGMMNALGDENSSYISPDELKVFDAQMTGEKYEGIGAWVDVTKDYLTIISPMIGSPAEKAGLKPGDKIIAINGEDMTGIDGELVRQRVLGPAGSTLTLTILRRGVELPFDVEIIRAAITSSNVIGRMTDENIAYIQLLTFGDKKTTQDFRKILSDLMAQKPDGVILDLRNNGGGLLDSAIEIASEFIGDGVIAYEKFGDGRQKVFNAKNGGKALKIPLVVLINEGSASASEIVAGAIQDRERGILVGVPSYGKGSVQIWNELMDEQGAVRITVANWLTPNKITIHGIGLQPDVLVEFTEEDHQNDIDPQLEEAIKILTTTNE